ncbi:nuclear transcription factor Y subunit B-4-like [Hordeum vulgare subsp. vulgare]|uniref:Transcription factor CBF/NF-Y/archaeal histone domain-containing protein n=2 Tax=Hordeum vulgare TaxID=4513 RepID=A0A8I6WJ93_HORVV|nr:nuclear transcription factor Y subunit B-4-like [Hordeum vulgare subsp. vulgare]AFE55548.1 NF-YB4 [Hordeum vulgare]
MSEAVGTPESGGGGGVKEQERFLPIANIGRIMRRGVPENGKIAKDAKESIQECVSEFISFITSEASDKCMKEKRKTINGDDLIWSMGTLGFEDYVEPLKLYLKLYREMEGDTSKGSKSEQAGKKEVALNGQPGSSFNGM